MWHDECFCGFGGLWTRQGPLFHRRDHIAHRTAHTLGKLAQSREWRVTFAPFQQADIGRIEVAVLRLFLLRQILCFCSANRLTAAGAAKPSRSRRATFNRMRRTPSSSKPYFTGIKRDSALAASMAVRLSRPTLGLLILNSPFKSRAVNAVGILSVCGGQN